MAGDDGDRYFSVVLTVAIALLAVANLLVFPALVVLRRRQPDTPRPFRVPVGTAGAWLASGLATGWCLLALAVALVPGLGTADPAAALPAGFEGERLAFTACVAIPLVLLGAVAVAASVACARRRRTAVQPIARA